MDETPPNGKKKKKVRGEQKKVVGPNLKVDEHCKYKKMGGEEKK